MLSLWAIENDQRLAQAEIDRIFREHRESCGLGEPDEPDHTYYADPFVCKPDAEARRWEDE